LTEPSIISALYQASQAGVNINLIVRSICTLRPGIVGVSENIHVRSIVGRFLEHSRVYAFCANEQNRLFIASADWMDRNLHSRVEACCPVEDVDAKKRLLFELQEVFMRDNCQSWFMREDGSYYRCPAGEHRFSAQEFLLRELAEK
jgi:polyphosphate kinase